MPPKGQASTRNLKANAPGGGTGTPIQVGYTTFNDPPPGAGGLNNNEYCFAELGTARRTDGQGTGTGNLAKAFGLPGELPMGAAVTFTNGGKSITAVKRDRGYGQGGDGVHSDPAYAVDFWDGQAYGGKSCTAALGLDGKGQIQAEYGGATGAVSQGGSDAAAAAAPGGGDPVNILQILTDLLTGNLSDLAVNLAMAFFTIIKDVVLGLADWIFIPWFHWNQRAAQKYTSDWLFSKDKKRWTVLPWTSAFWGLGYWLFFTDPESGNLKPAPVRRSHLARHVRRAQALPARRSLIKPKHITRKTPKKPTPVESKARVIQTGTMRATRNVPVTVTGTHAEPNGSPGTERHSDTSRVPLDREGTRTAGSENSLHRNTSRKPNAEPRPGDGSLPHRGKSTEGSAGTRERKGRS